MVVLMEDLNRVVNNADLVADSRNILGNLRKSHFTRFAALFSVMMVYYSRPVGNDVDHVCSFKFMSEDTSTIRHDFAPSPSIQHFHVHSFTWHDVNGEQNSFVPLPVRMPTKPCLHQFGLLVHCHYYDDLFNLPTSLQRQGQKKEEKLG